MGHVGVFLGDSGALEIETRLVGVLCALDGTKWLVAKDDDDDVVERVVVVVPEVDHERGYRAARAGVEDQVSGAGWIVQRASDPRVLVSTRALGRTERDALRSSDDSAIVLGERALRSLVRGRTDAVHVYTADAHGWNHVAAKPSAPIHARSFGEWLAKVPIEFASSSTVVVADDFDGTRDGSWTQEAYKFTWRALIANAVLMSVLIGGVTVLGIYELTSSLWIALAAGGAVVAATTAFVNHDVKHNVIGARAPTHPVRVAPKVRVADEVEDDDESADEEEERAAKR
jgi:hypothetical protein